MKKFAKGPPKLLYSYAIKYWIDQRVESQKQVHQVQHSEELIKCVETLVAILDCFLKVSVNCSTSIDLLHFSTQCK